MNEEIDLFKEEMNVLKDEVKLIAGINRDMKVDMKQDVRRIEKIVEDTEQRVKEDSREFSRDMRDLRKELEEKIKKVSKQSTCRDEEIMLLERYSETPFLKKMDFNPIILCPCNFSVCNHRHIFIIHFGCFRWYRHWNNITNVYPDF